jgi:hypothetical protein
MLPLAQYEALLPQQCMMGLMSNILQPLIWPGSDTSIFPCSCHRVQLPNMMLSKPFRGVVLGLSIEQLIVAFSTP